MRYKSVWSLAIDLSNSQTIYAGTIFGGVCKSTDGGANWVSFTTGTANGHVECLAIDPFNSQTLYAGTTFSLIYKSTDGGANWASFSSGMTSGNMICLAIDPSDSQTLYAGRGDGVWKWIPSIASSLSLTSPNGGENWPISSTPNDYLDLH